MSGNLPDRQNWTPALTVVLLLAIAAAAVGYMVDGNATGTDRLYLQNTAGPVLFDHAAHSQQAESCAVCHHPLYSAAEAVSCAECHGERPETDQADHRRIQEMHGGDCSLCHQETQGEASSCRQCHPSRQEEETSTVACTTCHDDGYSAEMLSHDEYQDIAEHSCLGCHAPQALADIYHSNCSGCHLQQAPQRFSQAGDEVRCGACHVP